MNAAVAGTLSLFLVATPMLIFLGQNSEYSGTPGKLSLSQSGILAKWGFNHRRDGAAHAARQQLQEKAYEVVDLAKQGWEWVAPGGRLHPQDFLEVYHGHLLIECLLALVIGYLFFQSSYRWSKKKASIEQLTEEEIDQLCEEWQPEPLCQTLRETKVKYQPPVLTSAAEKIVEINKKKVLNMASYNFLGVAGNKAIKESCGHAISKYGVGACGPRGFYGTIDVHLELEKRLASFMGTQEAIIYAYDLTTVPSILPAFANAKDLIVVDERADYGIQNGCNLSRARIVTFKHNDVEDLERVLTSEIAKHNALRKPLNRRYIVVEGIYKASGDIAALDKIAALKKKYKFRLVVDESFAFGVLGQSGRGACEHFNLSPDDVEIICSSMGNAMASVGGFCVGDREIVDHQRLSGLGYCFSAAAPPYLAVASMAAVDILQSPEAQQLRSSLHQNAKHLHRAVQNLKDLTAVDPVGNELSPVVHLQLSGHGDMDSDLVQLHKIAELCLQESDVLICVNKVSALDNICLAPSLRLVVTAAHTVKDIDRAVSALQRAAGKALKL